MTNTNIEYKIASILGTGRSGTTWLGSIINAHPQLAYRFEPFHRAPKGSQLSIWMEEMAQGQLNENVLPEIYKALKKADPRTEKPPFFPKKDLRQTAQGTLYKITRLIKPLRPVYSTLYTPRDDRLVVFKEVTFERQMDNLLSLLTVPAVYLVRHPSATVASLLRGQAEGKMPRGRLTVIKSLLEEHDRELAGKLAIKIDTMDDLQLNALLWRIDTEKAMRAIDRHNNCFLLTYEQLCDDAHRHIETICKLFKIDFHSQIKVYLDKLYEQPSSEQTKKPSDVRDAYFTVFRNPKTQKDAWKKNWSKANEKKVQEIVKDSITMERCAQIGNW